MNYKKDELKNSLILDQVYELLIVLGGEPILMNGYIISRTICHHRSGEGSHKLYYYDNTKLFKCYTQCSEEYFDIFDLVRKHQTIEQNIEWSLYKAISFVASFFGLDLYTDDSTTDQILLEDWKILEYYGKINEIKENKKQIIEPKIYDENILKYMPRPRILIWEQEGITREIIKKRNIVFNPVSSAIVIPHYNIDNKLIGIRERTLIKEQEQNGKYKPSKINGIMYNHALSFNLYNLNNSKENIKIIKKAIIFESEKACLMYQSYFGEDNDISVACCGSSLIPYQVQLLLSLGVQEIVVAFDKQFQEIGDKEFKRWTKKLTDIDKKYRKFVQISFIFDKKNELEYKMSPIDKGEKIFLNLFKERIIL